MPPQAEPLNLDSWPDAVSVKYYSDTDRGLCVCGEGYRSRSGPTALELAVWFGSVLTYHPSSTSLPIPIPRPSYHVQVLSPKKPLS